MRIFVEEELGRERRESEGEAEGAKEEGTDEGPSFR